MMVAGLAGLIGAGGVALTMASAPVNTTDRAEIEKIVREYILTHPEILPEAMQNLQSRELSKAVTENRKAIETPFGGAWEGAQDGDVTIVEFFDYACGYCRASLPDITRLLAEDKGLKIVYRDMPVLGEASLVAARASLLAAQKGNYINFHKALFASGRPSAAAVDAAMVKAGLNAGASHKDMQSAAIEAELGKTTNLQRALNLTGTPSWVIGDKVIVGAVGYDGLKKAIAEARAAKN
jgi:protein-disulfide isomerase